MTSLRFEYERHYGERSWLLVVGTWLCWRWKPQSVLMEVETSASIVPSTDHMSLRCGTTHYSKNSSGQAHLAQQNI